MVQRLGRKEKLDDLPGSEDKYWKGQKAETYQVSMNSSNQCKHNFVLVKAREVECTKCRIGYILEVIDKIKNGHIYREERLVI